MNTTFHNDLNNEQILGRYLDKLYETKFHGSEYTVERCHDLNRQNKGVDIIISGSKKQFFIDEKAQLDYLENSLPTFAFELSYFKLNFYKQGWLFDDSKLTNFYFLITAIKCQKPYDLNSGVSSCRITSVDRKALQNYLEAKGLTKARLEEYDSVIRRNGKFKNNISELDTRTQGNIYYSAQKSEKPVNIVLYLQNLINEGIAKAL